VNRIRSEGAGESPQLKGGEYLAIRYSERLASEGAVTSVGSRGDIYDNAMAESVHGLYKAECVWREGPWRGRSDLEIATASWVSWWNNERLHSELDYVPRRSSRISTTVKRHPLSRLETNSRSLHQIQGGSIRFSRRAGPFASSSASA
jgi:putative transposase